MGKSSNFSGQPVYSQVIYLLDKSEIIKISRQTAGSEAYVKKFGGYEHLIVMLFGVLKHFDSLRELEIGMKAEANKHIDFVAFMEMPDRTWDEITARNSQKSPPSTDSF